MNTAHALTGEREKKRPVISIIAIYKTILHYLSTTVALHHALSNIVIYNIDIHCVVQTTHYEVVSKVEHDVEDVSDQEDEAEEECNHSNCHT